VELAGEPAVGVWGFGSWNGQTKELAFSEVAIFRCGFLGAQLGWMSPGLAVVVDGDEQLILRVEPKLKPVGEGDAEEFFAVIPGVCVCDLRH
jgi:hypothetical protein